ncbi:hydrolase, NUDIX family [Corynebacterium sp. CMW7794]|uniref:NUDIX domain-containing protein n=1 Tax=Corynebacterium TaxID=1716 RepID=UPI00079406BC|nr:MULTISPECIES: NUDIX hydrolase [Corynebacterium]KXB54851.1 hydrolase, NUDIX family [Corynebacterium sp. DNF00584]KXI15948.1 hydrolase, NUDIX family [Corynebacterium sp. CMW7794]MBF9012268.1 NUDIX hydrolase [Corynebacterium phoceense]OFL77851.1 ADP-ribose pyrophosphatase [Corynebacterium sp. HMSC077B05]OFP20677.1 ADP-ribose pyrophosphatase [Corynebacterium sp. HMSC065A05]
MSHEFKTLRSELLLDAPIIAVRRDEVVMPDGHVASREVVEHFGAVAIAAVDDQGRIAMVNQYRRSVDRHLLELPAGLLDIKGEDELTGAQRELQEEAGLAAEQWATLADLVTSPGFCEEAVRVFLARDLHEVEALHAVGDEEADMDFLWLPLEEAVAKILSGEIVNSIAVGGILAADRVINHGGATRPADAPFDLRPQSLAARRQGPDMKKL